MRSNSIRPPISSFSRPSFRSSPRQRSASIRFIRIVNRAVKETIARYPQFRPLLTGPVSIGETNEDPLLLTLVEGFASPAPPASQSPTAPQHRGVSQSRDFSQAGAVGPLSGADPVAHGVEKVGVSSLEIRWTSRSPFPPTVSDYGSPAVHDLVTRARNAVWESAGWAPSSTNPFDIIALERSDDAGFVRVHLTMSSRGWNWLEFRDLKMLGQLHRAGNGASRTLS